MPRRNAAARWEGSLTEGRGEVRLGSGAYEGPYSFRSRFEGGDGTNPEELIAAAHAGCFSMALLADLARAGHAAEHVETEASVSLEFVNGGFSITRIGLSTRAQVPGLAGDEFVKLAEGAERSCPVSRALAGVNSIELKAELVT